MRNLLCLILLLAGDYALAANPVVETALRNEYQGTERFFREFYAEDTLQFDEAGHIRGNPSPGAWTVVGSVNIDQVQLKPDMLELKGRRNVILFDESKRQMKHARVEIKWTARIQTHDGPAQQAQLESALMKIFLTPGEDISSVLPEYWQDYIARFHGGKVAGEPCQDSQPNAGGQPPVTVSEGVREGLRIAGNYPYYSPLARHVGVEGEVQLRAVISKSGDVVKTCILHALGAGLDDESVHVVRGWKYQPYLLNGKPVEIGTTIRMRFNM